MEHYRLAAGFPRKCLFYCIHTVYELIINAVNKNLIGAGHSNMTTEQKKKLLWGSKKSTPAEEVFLMN